MRFFNVLFAFKHLSKEQHEQHGEQHEQGDSPIKRIPEFKY